MITQERVIRLIFGFKVRYLRQLKQYSYQELAKATGLSTSYLNDIEKGKRYPKPDKIATIASALGVDYNYMVATNASKKLQPIIDLFHSNFFKLFPIEEFGISPEKLVELFTHTPDKVNAFISTIFKLARNYQVGEEQFFLEALRSYQDMHNNYFPELELAAKSFKKEYSIKGTLPFTKQFLEDQLEEIYGISVNKDILRTKELLSNVRSYFKADTKTLYLKKELSDAQVNFLLARELGFQYLKITERPYETTIVNIDSFEKLLNNYKASHFAAALLMDEDDLSKDVRTLARNSVWHSDLLTNMTAKYNVTAEMLLQRLTNILPHHFGIEDLFFLRMTGSPDLKNFTMTKDLHLSQMHMPYNNELHEDYCNRWVSVTSIKELSLLKKSKKKHRLHADAQISKYWETDKEYLCLSIAKDGFELEQGDVSVTLGMLLTPQLKSLFYFLTDPQLKYREVHTTCQRCGIVDCDARVAYPTIIEKQQVRRSLLKELEEL